jgi:DNA mismatch endonuclease (patch repair protein)
MSRAKNDTARGRSENMRAIRSRDNRTTEMRLKAILIRNAVSGWKLRPKNIHGHPDFYFPEQEVVIFVDGCFWHGCPKCGHTPRTNARYWSAKIARNKRRDRFVLKTLRSFGYSVVRIWECRLRVDSKYCLSRILNELNGG